MGIKPIIIITITNSSMLRTKSVIEKNILNNTDNKSLASSWLIDATNLTISHNGKDEIWKSQN